MSKYDFSTISYEIVGTIFQTLIPKEDRRKFGQYLTPSEVVDLMLSFCLDESTNDIFDPACGVGTFLVRAWSRFKYLDENKKHREILKSLWGTDISEYPAHLAILNLRVIS